MVKRISFVTVLLFAVIGISNFMESDYGLFVRLADRCIEEGVFLESLVSFDTGLKWADAVFIPKTNTLRKMTSGYLGDWFGSIVIRTS